MTNPDRSELVKLADTITGHVAALANEPLRMPLTTWNVVSNDILAAAESLRRLASSDCGGVKVRELEWRGPVDAFPTTIWEAKTPFGHYVIEEVSASDSPAYEVRFAGGHVISVKDGLNDAKAAAQADYEARIKSALAEVPAVKGESEPVAWADKYGETHPITAESKKTLSNNPTTEPYWSRFSIPLYAAHPTNAGMREALEPFANIANGYDDELDGDDRPVGPVQLKFCRNARAALTSPGATTKSDGGHGLEALGVDHVE